MERYYIFLDNKNDNPLLEILIEGEFKNTPFNRNFIKNIVYSEKFSNCKLNSQDFDNYILNKFCTKVINLKLEKIKKNFKSVYIKNAKREQPSFKKNLCLKKNIPQKYRKLLNLNTLNFTLISFKKSIGNMIEDIYIDYILENFCMESMIR